MAVDLNKIVQNLKKTYKHSDISENIKDPKDFVSTGNKAFDLIADGGIPFGYITELLGLSSSGKSLFIQQTIANAMKDYDAIGILIDRENAYTNKRGEQLGIDNSKLIVGKPADIHNMYDAVTFIEDSLKMIKGTSEVKCAICGKEFKKITANHLKTHGISLEEYNEEYGETDIATDSDQYVVIAIDSISAFDKDVDIDKSDSGRKAKAAHEGLRRLLNSIDNKTMLLIANQVTFKIGVMYGDPKTTTAGESMKYYSTVRFSLSDRKRIANPAENNEVLGNWIGVEAIKTRLGPCYRTCYLRHLYDSGIDYYSGYARLLAHRGYLSPKNTDKFNSFKQSTLKDEDGNEVNEHKIEKYLEDHPELDFDEYPKFNYGD